MMWKLNLIELKSEMSCLSRNVTHIYIHMSFFLQGKSDSYSKNENSDLI